MLREFVAIFVALLLGLMLLAAGIAWLASPAKAEGLPPSPPRIYPAVCDVSYELAPGARAVLLCAVRAPRGGTLEGIAQIESGHEDVDASLLYSLHASRHAFSVTNTSTTTTVRATARGKVW